MYLRARAFNTRLIATTSSRVRNRFLMIASVLAMVCPKYRAFCRGASKSIPSGLWAYSKFVRIRQLFESRANSVCVPLSAIEGSSGYEQTGDDGGYAGLYAVTG